MAESRRGENGGRNKWDSREGGRKDAGMRQGGGMGGKWKKNGGFMKKWRDSWPKFRKYWQRGFKNQFAQRHVLIDLIKAMQ
jgi:hypothetical protein